MAKFGLIFSILGIFCLSFFIEFEKGVYPIIFNLSILPLGILAYMEGLGFGLLAAIVCFSALLFYIFSIDVEFGSVAPTLFAFSITPIVFASLRKISERTRVLLLEDVKNLGTAIEILEDKEAKLNSELKGLYEKVSKIAGLYEITKGMSSTLLFQEIFQIFSEFLRKNFKFIACKLILVTPDEKTIEKVYKVETSLDNDNVTRPQVATQDLIDAEILNEVCKTKRIISWEDFIAIPLICQNEIIGILNVEGLQEDALEKFLIVARQFSLEMEKARLYETVQELSITDGVTGVFVRRYFLEILKEEFERSMRHRSKLSFLMIDLDHFKECNDKFGHLVGDVVLREISKVLRQNIREIDLIGRYGGEEFSLLLPETDKTSANLVAERLREAVANQDFRAYDEVIRMTISVGISTFPDDAKTITELIEFADKALYEAKAQGRNRVIVYRAS